MNDLIDRQAAIEAIGINTWAGQRLLKVPTAQPERHICRECKWARFYGNVDKNGNLEYMWFCTNWDGGTDEEGFCHEWERRTDE